LAIIPVVLFHANLGIPGGFVGVDIFFVISGFLIIRIIYSEAIFGTFGYAGFYERRVRRLLPAAFLVFLVTTIWALSAMTWFDVESFGKSLASANCPRVLPAQLSMYRISISIGKMGTLTTTIFPSRCCTLGLLRLRNSSTFWFLCFSSPFCGFFTKDL
jgi:hypothetical protein